jgi:hypothetical protein
MKTLNQLVYQATRKRFKNNISIGQFEICLESDELDGFTYSLKYRGRTFAYWKWDSVNQKSTVEIIRSQSNSRIKHLKEAIKNSGYWTQSSVLQTC